MQVLKYCKMARGYTYTNTQKYEYHMGFTEENHQKSYSSTFMPLLLICNRRSVGGINSERKCVGMWKWTCCERYQSCFLQLGSKDIPQEAFLNLPNLRFLPL
jgi:hypothetical protein